MNKLSLIFAFLLLASCEQKISQSQINSENSNSLYGNWLVKEYFDTINQPNYSGSLSSSDLGITEIVFSPSFEDSALIINEDLEMSMEKIEFLSKDSILLNLTDPPYNLIIYNNETQTLNYQIDERYKPYHFIKAPDSLVEHSSYPTAFRNSLNEWLSRNFFSHGLENHPPLFLDRHGKVTGFNDYTSYKIIVNGDQQNIEDADRIEFSDGTYTDAYGLKLKSNGFDLYTLKLVSSPNEKPIYKTDSLFKSYTVKR
jgi:hypothetical protein